MDIAARYTSVEYGSGWQIHELKNWEANYSFSEPATGGGRDRKGWFVGRSEQDSDGDEYNYETIAEIPDTLPNRAKVAQLMSKAPDLLFSLIECSYLLHHLEGLVSDGSMRLDVKNAVGRAHQVIYSANINRA